MTAPDMVSIIAAALVAHWDFWTDTTQEPFVDRCGGCKEVVHTHGTQLKTALAAHQSRAVLDALSEELGTDWGMRTVLGAHYAYDSEATARLMAKVNNCAVVTRVAAGPWAAVEG